MELGLEEPVLERSYAKKIQALTQSSKTEEALAVADEAIARYPNTDEFLAAKAALLQALGREAEATAMLKERDESVPESAVVPYTEGELFLMQGRYVEALVAYDEAIKRQPEFAKAYVGKGIALGSLGNVSVAALAFTQALRRDPENVDAYTHLSNALLMLGRPQEALETAEKGLQYDSNFADLYRKRGLAYEQLRRYPEALAAYEKALELDPKQADVYHDKGVLLDKMGRPEDALASLNKALELNPRLHLSYHSKAIVLQRLGCSQEALEACDAALRLEPGFLPARVKKASIEAQLTRSGAASSTIGTRPVQRVGTTGRRGMRGWLKRRLFWFLSVCVLLLLVFLHSVLPAGAATITLAPDLNLSYRVAASDHTDLTAGFIHARLLTYTTSTRSQSAAVTTTGTLAPTSAHGKVVFSNVSEPVTVSASTNINIGNGLTLQVDDSQDLKPGNTYTLPAHVVQAGSKGNIPADSIDGEYALQLFGGGITSAFVYLSNPAPFSGGTDTYNGPIVSQSDIDGTTPAP
jgi:tetratricopeptide (TPR) repeat protein